MNLWDQILARIETKVNRHSFYTWFKPTTFVAEDRASVTVRVPNEVFKDWLTKRDFRRTRLRALRRLFDNCSYRRLKNWLSERRQFTIWFAFVVNGRLQRFPSRVCQLIKRATQFR